MIKGFRNDILTLLLKFLCTSLISDILQSNFFLGGKVHISSKKFTIPELSRSIMPKVDNGQRLKYYTLGNPINIDSDLIQVIIPEECIEETIREAYRTRKIELVRGAVSRQIFKIHKIIIYLSVLEFNIFGEKKEPRVHQGTMLPGGAP